LFYAGGRGASVRGGGFYPRGLLSGRLLSGGFCPGAGLMSVPHLRGPTSKGRGYRKGGEGAREGKAGRGRMRGEGKGRKGPPCVSLNFA